MKAQTLIVFTFLSLPTFASNELNLELGSVENSYNQVQIPGDDGTRFNLATSFPDSNFYHRISYAHKFKSPHGVRFLYAPLKLTGDETYSKDINFQGVQFNQDEKIETEYQFNTYRGTYFYQLLDETQWSVRVGGTVLVRDARIKLVQGNKSKFKQNTGLAPLVYFYTEYKWANGFRAGLDFDGLAASQGRAFDIAVMGGYYFAPNFHWNLGLRMLEGGSDNENVYNFAQLNYLFTSLQINFE